MDAFLCRLDFCSVRSAGMQKRYYVILTKGKMLGVVTTHGEVTYEPHKNNANHSRTQRYVYLS